MPAKRNETPTSPRGWRKTEIEFSGGPLIATGFYIRFFWR